MWKLAGGQKGKEIQFAQYHYGPFIFVDEVSTCYSLVLTVDSKYTSQCS